MDQMDVQISRFRDAAGNLLQQQVAELKNMKERTFSGDKLSRIQVFNTHLEAFRKELKKLTRQFVTDQKAESGKDKLESELSKVSEEMVGEYMVHRYAD